MNASDSADRVVNIEISFPLTFSFICGAAVVLLTGLYYYVTSHIEHTIIFFGTSVAAAGQVTATFYTARLLSTTIKQNKRAEALDREASTDRKEHLDFAKESRKYDMLKHTARFGERWNDAGMYPARDCLRLILEHDGNVDDLINMCNANKTHVIHILNFIEEIATAKRIGILDEALAKANFNSVVILTWTALTPWVTKYRNTVSVNDLWIEVELLANAWKNGGR